MRGKRGTECKQCGQGQANGSPDKLSFNDRRGFSFNQIFQTAIQPLVFQYIECAAPAVLAALAIAAVQGALLVQIAENSIWDVWIFRNADFRMIPIGYYSLHILRDI